VIHLIWQFCNKHFVLSALFIHTSVVKWLKARCDEVLHCVL